MSRAPKKVAITSPKRHATETILVLLKVMTGYASKQVAGSSQEALTHEVKYVID